MPVAVSEPRSVDISLSQGISIVWRDGHLSRYPILYLRERCPCATCAGTHGEATTRVRAADGRSNPLPMFKPVGATLKAAQPVGRYALQFQFSDDHNTGLFTWNYLREICPCDLCRPPSSGGA
ncbi:MAG TPA: DUF971 domain-containing protein [Terriglobales bacterium]|nr:DUF971 domain-containing protein [Terriglobales bacterium]